MFNGFIREITEWAVGWNFGIKSVSMVIQRYMLSSGLNDGFLVLSYVVSVGNLILLFPCADIPFFQ